MAKSGGRASIVLADQPGRVPLGIGWGVGVALTTVAAFVAAAVPAREQAVRFGLVAAAVSVCAAITVDVRNPAGVAVIGGLIGNGFLENHLGSLSWHGMSDVVLIMLLVVAGTAGLLVGGLRRYLRRLRSDQRIDAQLRAMTAGFQREEVNFDA